MPLRFVCVLIRVKICLALPKPFRQGILKREHICLSWCLSVRVRALPIPFLYPLIERLRALPMYAPMV